LIILVNSNFAIVATSLRSQRETFSSRNVRQVSQRTQVIQQNVLFVKQYNFTTHSFNCMKNIKFDLRFLMFMDSAKKYKIVYAEDSKYIANVVKRNLLNAGFDVYYSENVQGVFELVKRIKPDLVLLDNLMPIKDGFSVLSELKSDEETKNIPIIFFTTEADKSHIIQSIGSGAADYIVKDSRTIGDLIPRIQKLLKKIEEKNKY
jgi:two-component system phosphate regulon response regulator PhoB